MSKLAIVLCVVLFSSSGNSFSWTESMESMEKKIEELANSVITKFQENFEATQFQSATAASKLSNKTIEFGWEVANEVSAISAKFGEEINELVHLATGVNINECLIFSDRLAHLSSEIISKTESCMNDKLNTGLGIIDSISEAANDALVEVDKVKEEAQHCDDDVENAKSALTSIFCYKMKAAKATWISMKFSPKITFGWTQLKFLMVTLKPSLNYCTKYERAALILESGVITQRTKDCIQKKIDESPVTTEIYPRTEKY